MADVIEYKIHGDDLQLVEVFLDPGEGIRAEVGTMAFMKSGIEMQTNTGGGLFKGFKRMFTGESFFISTFLNNSKEVSSAGFAAPYPGKIIPIDLSEQRGEFLCQKDSFLCAANGIEVEVAFTKKIGAGFFGGEGFILQKLQGDGMAFVHAGGTIVEMELEPNEEIRVDTGCVVGFSPIIDYDIQFVGGFKNALFGGEGLFLAKLTGPGKVYLQSLPLARLADRIAKAASFSQGQGEVRGSSASRGLGEGIINSFLNN